MNETGAPKRRHEVLKISSATYLARRRHRKYGDEESLAGGGKVLPVASWSLSMEPDALEFVAELCTVQVLSTVPKMRVGPSGHAY